MLRQVSQLLISNEGMRELIDGREEIACLFEDQTFGTAMGSWFHRHPDSTFFIETTEFVRIVLIVSLAFFETLQSRTS